MDPFHHNDAASEADISDTPNSLLRRSLRSRTQKLLRGSSLGHDGSESPQTPHSGIISTPTKRSLRTAGKTSQGAGSTSMTFVAESPVLTGSVLSGTTSVGVASAFHQASLLNARNSRLEENIGTESPSLIDSPHRRTGRRRKATEDASDTLHSATDTRESSAEESMIPDPIPNPFLGHSSTKVSPRSPSKTAKKRATSKKKVVVKGTEDAEIIFKYDHPLSPGEEPDLYTEEIIVEESSWAMAILDWFWDTSIAQKAIVPILSFFGSILMLIGWAISLSIPSLLWILAYIPIQIWSIIYSIGLFAFSIIGTFVSRYRAWTFISATLGLALLLYRAKRQDVVSISYINDFNTFKESFDVIYRRVPISFPSVSLPFFLAPAAPIICDPADEACKADVSSRLDVFLTRLNDLETRLDQIFGSVASKKDTDAAINEIKRTQKSDMDSLQAQLKSLSTTLGQLTSSLSKSQVVQEEVNRLSEKITTIVSRLDSLNDQLISVTKPQQRLAIDIQQLSTDQKSLLAQLHTLSSDLEDVKRELTSSDYVKSLSKQVLELFKPEIPNYVFGQRNKDGSLELPTIFWDALNIRFASVMETKELSSQLEKVAKENLASISAINADSEKAIELIRTELSSILKKLSSQPESVSSVDAQEVERFVRESLSWEAFLDKNRHDIQQFIDTKVTEELGALISKDEVLDILQATLEKEVFSADQELLKSQKDILSQVKALERRVIDSKSVEHLIDKRLESSLHDLKSDPVGLPDYALETAGGRVYGPFTSKTYEKEFDSWAMKMAGKALGVRIASGKPPKTALQPDVTPGQCWAMEGHQGTLGIALARKIIPTNVTIQHMSKDLMFKNGLLSAPRKLRVYGVFDTDLFASVNMSSLPMTTTDITGSVFLGAFEFHPQTSSLKTFQLVANSKPVSIVVLVIDSNWGHSSWTCLYRVRVHGREIV